MGDQGTWGDGLQRFARVSVLYPRGDRTGGPEALHQLVDSLRRQGVDAWLVPFPGTEDRTDVPEYAHYDAPIAPQVADSSRDAVVYPEVYLGWDRPRHAQGFCWWLSVDGSSLFGGERTWVNRRLVAVRSMPRLVARCAYEQARRPVVRARTRRFEHVAQSSYAAGFVRRRLGVPVEMLSDYVTPGVPAETDRDAHRPVVSYSATKGARLAARARELVGDRATWVPIVGMTRQQVLDTLARSDVYLDLGHEPGKDRMPREAALLGAVSLVGRIGAGADPIDFPLPESQKVPMTGDVGAEAAQRLAAVLDDLPLHRSLQEPYRRALASERDVFDDEVRRVFVEPRPTGRP